MSGSNDPLGEVAAGAAAFMMFVWGAALLVWGLAFLALVCFAIAGVVAVHRYHKYMREAESAYQQVEMELGANLEAGAVLSALYGAGVSLSNDGWDSPMDWLDETVFGIGDEP